MGRYFIDTEFDGFNGELISIALVPDQAGHPYFYAITDHVATNPWVVEHVVPFLVGEGHRPHRGNRVRIAQLLTGYLAGDAQPRIVADWPEDLTHLTRLLITGPGMMVPIRHMSFEYHDYPEFSTAKASAIPHNALEDARSFRDYVLSKEDWNG